MTLPSHRSVGLTRPGRHHRAGWTLVELIGVLAVLSILAAMLAPVLIYQIDQQVRRDEEERLRRIAVGFETAVARTRSIPGATNWATFVAAQIGWRSAEIQTNSRGNTRVFLIDPALRVGKTAGSVLPFTQDWEGSLAPVSPRVLIVSSVGEPLPAGLVSGVASTTNAFNAIWSAPVAGTPSGWTWSGRPEDLRIQRVAMDRMFYPVVLNSFDSSKGRFGVDTGVTNLMTTNLFTTWYLKGTALRLHANDGALQSTEVVQDAVSYVYEHGTWRGRAFMSMGTKRLSGQDLQDAVDLFLSAPWNVNAKNSVRQQDVVNALTAYMQQYIAWANGGFSYVNANLKPVQDAQTILGNRVTDLIFKP